MIPSLVSVSFAFLLGDLPASNLYSGKLLTPTGKPVVGIEVAIAGTRRSTKTDSQGLWILDTTTSGIASRKPPAATPLRQLSIPGMIGSSSVGWDALGRLSPGAGPQELSTSTSAPRAMALRDTLVYSLQGKVYLKDTASVSMRNMVRVFDTTWNASVVYGWFTDARDGKIYRSLRLGRATWMAQNLNYAVDSSWWYMASSDSGAKYGRLYLWPAALALGPSCLTISCQATLPKIPRGICPVGWHVPFRTDWRYLLDTLLPNARSALILKSRFGWDVPSDQGIDSLGMRILPAPFRFASGGFNGAGWLGQFEVANERNPDDAASAIFQFSSDRWMDGAVNKQYGLSLRCIQD